jgi:phage/plasmid-associated DNA primase
MSKNDYDGIVFSDSDTDDGANDELREQVNFQLQENTNDISRAFKEFLSTPSFINNKGDETTNIVDRHKGKCYNIPDRKIPKFMKFLEVFRRKKLKVMINEKQQQYSGIMLDFDIKVNHGGESQIKPNHYHRLSIMVMKLLIKFVHFSKEEIGESKTIHIAFTKKPKILYDSEGNYYKDGIHMIIPGFQITREFKKLLISTIEEENLLDKVFKEITPHESNTRAEFLDINSAHVPVFFVGSASKIHSPAYRIDSIYEVGITVGDPDDVIPTKTDKFNDPNVNICYEFSLNWQRNSEKGGIIKKTHYDIRPEYANLLERYKTKKSHAIDEEMEEDDKLYGDMSILNMHDADTKHIKNVLDTLHPKRAEDYALWFNVVCALAHTSPSYKPLAEYFSRKSPEKFDEVKFDQIWDSILLKTNNSLTMGSIHYWAQQDNPDKYQEVRNRSIYNRLCKKIYDPMNEGQFGHYDMAQLLHTILKDKYVYDQYDPEGESWYEFMIENEDIRPGELYKWRRYSGGTPLSLLKHISDVLPNLFRTVLAKIKTSLSESAEDLAKYHNLIYTNFKRSCRTLFDSGFKHSATREARQLFEQVGFGDSLDSNPLILGTLNGVLELGPKCKLISGYHGHKISKFTKAKYIKYNPHSPLTKKIIVALRNLFPDHEPDTFEYIMHYLASTLDGCKKESMFMLLIGKGSNGKSFLVELHKAAIGDTYGVKMPLSFLTSRSKDAEGATPALMQLKDAHFAYYSESNKFEVLNMAKIKEFTGQETMAGRKLHQDYVNFKPKCHHLVASNNDFEVHGTDHGTWRRIDRVDMAIKFCNPATDEYDENNPFERLADPTLGSNWAEDEEVVGTYLGILAYYYESLQNKYKGKVRNVAHPHIIKATEDFRNRQDRVNNFLNMSLVKCADSEYEMPMSTVRDLYIKWYEGNYPGDSKDYQRVAGDQLENSKIQSYIKKTKRGNFLRGYRILDLTEEKNDDEEYYTDLFETSNKDLLKVKKESATEFHDRLCREYDAKQKGIKLPNSEDSTYVAEVALKRTILQEQKGDDPDGSDSDIEELIKSTKKREPSAFTRRGGFNLGNNKVGSSADASISNLDSNGIKLPRKKVAAKFTPKGKKERREFASMGGGASDSESDSDSSDSD